MSKKFDIDLTSGPSQRNNWGGTLKRVIISLVILVILQKNNWGGTLKRVIISLVILVFL